MYTIANLGDFSSVIQLSVPGFENLIPGYMAEFIYNVEEVNNLKSNFTEYSSEWAECEISRSLFESTIPVYTIVNNAYEVQYFTMENYLNLILGTVIIM